MAHQSGTHDQNNKAGQKSGKSSDPKMASSGSGADAKTGKQGASHEQSMKSGQQDHKNKH